MVVIGPLGHHRLVRRTFTLVVLVLLLASSVPAEVAASPSPAASNLVRPAAVAGLGFRADISELSPQLRARMTGSSWRRGCPVPLDDLRLIRLRHWGFDDEVHGGKLVVHRWFADELADVFGALFDARFPIRRMFLVDRYGADDMRSMRADNTSAFNCRYRNGVCCTWSMHAYGKAIDINPVENPYVGPWGVSPPNGDAYVDRSPVRRGMIERGDVVWSGFDAMGWPWGGSWTNVKDYQHFSPNGR